MNSDQVPSLQQLLRAVGSVATPRPPIPHENRGGDVALEGAGKALKYDCKGVPKITEGLGYETDAAGCHNFLKPLPL